MMTHFSLQTGNYQPGVVTDVIREVREGTRVREEALLNRVKNMIEERQWSINETNLRVVRELEELKVSFLSLSYKNILSYTRFTIIDTSSPNPS